MSPSRPGSRLRWGADALVGEVRDRVVRSTNGLFAHGPYALEKTLLYRGDPGLFGPGSMTWLVVGDTSVFVGGIRALLVQAAHPEVAAGVADHSRYRQDPLGRLSRTAAYVTATSFGALPEVEEAVQDVRRRHRPVEGTSHRGLPYDADDAALGAWVHNTLTDSFLAAYRAYGTRPCPTEDADRFVAEQARVGALLGASPLPTTAAELSEWVAGHPALEPSPGGSDAVGFLRRPPLPVGVRAGYRLLFRAALATMPERALEATGLRPAPGDRLIGRAAVHALRSALGGSPDWRLALERVGATGPTDIRFHQPLPERALSAPAPGDVGERL